MRPTTNTGALTTSRIFKEYCATSGWPPTGTWSISIAVGPSGRRRLRMISAKSSDAAK